MPDPVPKWNFKTPADSKISMKDLVTFTSVAAKMPSWFNFQVKPQVKGFKITMSKSGVVSSEASTNNKITSSQEKLLSKARPGTIILLEDITVRMPDGTTRRSKMTLRVTK